MPTFTNLINAIVTGSANVDDADFRTWGGELEGYAVGFDVSVKSTGYTVLAADRGTLIRCTAGLTLTLTAAATIGAGYMVAIKADGGNVTIDPNASEQVNGATTLVLADGSWCLLYCTGSEWRALVVGTAGIADLIDEDDMATDSATRPPSQQSVKAYTDASGMVQRVYASTATHSTFTTASPALPVDDTIPQITEGTEILSVAITPTLSANRLRIAPTVMLGHGTNGGQIAWGLFRSGQTDAIRAGFFVVPSNNAPSPLAFEVEIEAGTTSAVTFSLRVDTASGTGAVNGNASGRFFGGAAVSEMSVTEVKA